MMVLRACEVGEELDTGAEAALVDREVREQERGSTVATARRRKRAKSKAAWTNGAAAGPRRLWRNRDERSNRAREKKQEKEGRGHTIPAFL